MHQDYRSTSVGCQDFPGEVVGTPQPGQRREQIPSSTGSTSNVQASEAAPGAVLKVPSASPWGSFLASFPWDWFVTLTFRGEVGEWGAERKFRKLVRQMRHDAGHRVEWFRVTEWHKFRNVPHYHALFTDCKQLRRLRYVDWWWGQGFGTARVSPYDKQLGAGCYLGKYLLKQDSDLSVSRGLKRFAPGALEDSHGLPLMSLQLHNADRGSTVGSSLPLTAV